VVLKELKESFRCSPRQPLHIGYRDFLEIEVCGPDNPVKFYFRVPELQVSGDEVWFSRVRAMSEWSRKISGTKGSAISKGILHKLILS